MSEQFGPWNPGIDSRLPTSLLPLVTLVRPENVFESIEELEELRDFSGLPLEELATFRPQRLMVHELLIRVSADYAVSDGNDYEDLGINFRALARRLLDGYLMPGLGEVDELYAKCREEIDTLVNQQLDTLLTESDSRDSADGSEKSPWWRTLFARREPPPSTPQPDPVTTNISRWTERALDQSRPDPDRAVDNALARVIGSVLVKHGQLRGDRELLGRLVSHYAMNTYATLRVGELIQPWIEHGADKENFRRLPRQSSPVIMNVKGASAAGKSTLRPLQRQLAQQIGLNWSDFALISPDIFRKFLLDYDSLGEDYKYAGTLSGEELQIVDQKLDRYVTARAATGHIPHLLIDRFRFDSFTPRSPQEGSNLLTRFGSKVFMFFVVTPPHQTVERAWHRGTQVGRFKAVDDLLDHNIEAFNGMPHLFFTWALNTDKDVHYEFLDNSVEKGQQPRTIAFGSNGALTILDVVKMADINRFQKLNVNATDAAEVYPANRTPSLLFVKDCVEKLPSVEFVDYYSNNQYALVIAGRRVSLDTPTLAEAVGDQLVAGQLQSLLEKLPATRSEHGQSDRLGPRHENSATLGASRADQIRPR